MTLRRISGVLPAVAARPRAAAADLDAAAWRHLLPSLGGLEATDEVIGAARTELLTLLAQDRICGQCEGYERCGKSGDARGMYDHPQLYNGHLVLETSYCRPFREYQALRRAGRYALYSSRSDFDRRLTFDTFPDEQRRKHPQLFAAARELSDTYEPHREAKGLYVFGPAGVGKTHLLHAVMNRLEERRVPCIFIQAEALFDRLRSAIGDGRDIEPVLEAFAAVPVLSIDEIGQERANEFTLEKLFRIINQRFNHRLPTLFTSNYAPPDLYARLPETFLNLVDPLRSRVIGMSKVAYLDGEDHRIASMDVLDL